MLFFFFDSDYDLHFPVKGVNDVVVLPKMTRSLTEFTACMWMSSNSSQGTLLSYAVPNHDNELMIAYNRYIQLTIDNKNR